MSFPESKANIEQDIETRSASAWAHKYVVPGQNYAVMSIIDRQTPPAAVKVYGTYATLDEANAASAEIISQNDFFDVFVANTNAWLPVPCSHDFVEDVHYQEDKMNEIRQGFTLIKEKNAKQLAENIKKDMEDKKSRAIEDTLTKS